VAQNVTPQAVLGENVQEDGQKLFACLSGSANLMESFPEKPKGMHWRTYERLWWEHHEAEMEHLAGMREWLDKMEKKLD
jgi:hypothetical protein